MIKYYVIREGNLLEGREKKNADVVRLIAPTRSELEIVSREASVPLDFLSAACDRDERPRMESENGVHLLVLRVPHEDAGSDTPFVTVAFSLILTKDRVISVCSVDSSVWDAVKTGKGNIPDLRSPLEFLCRVFLSIARLYLTHLNFIHLEANRVEREIHHSMRNEMLIRMLNLEKCLVYFTTSLRGLEPVLSRFPRLVGRPLTEHEKDLIDDVQIEFRQASDLAEIHSNILSGMMDAFASIISNNLNVVMKLLTSITFILMLPTLIASVYGMNVRLPFQNSPHAFAITMLMSLVLSGIGIVLFKKKNFF